MYQPIIIFKTYGPHFSDQTLHKFHIPKNFLHSFYQQNIDGKPQRESILDEYMRHQPSSEIDFGPSGISRTTHGSPIVGEGATDGIPDVYLAGFKKPDPPAF